MGYLEPAGPEVGWVRADLGGHAGAVRYYLTWIAAALVVAGSSFTTLVIVAPDNPRWLALELTAPVVVAFGGGRLRSLDRQRDKVRA